MTTTEPPAPLQPTQAFLDACRDLGVEFEPKDLERLGRWLAMLLETNCEFNLTSITEPDEAWMRHVFDSLTLLPAFAELPEGAKVADVGSGGGAPGLVLAIALPALRFTLIEATAKKAAFLDRLVRDLGLRNVRIVNDRAESVGAVGSPLRERFDAATARAVGRLNVCVELVVPLLKPGGQALLTKGAKAQQELAEAERALRLLRAECVGVLETPTGRLVLVEKSGPTPRGYPRRPGEPKRAPL